jgi:hypothetical protein
LLLLAAYELGQRRGEPFINYSVERLQVVANDLVKCPVLRTSALVDRSTAGGR